MCNIVLLSISHIQMHWKYSYIITQIILLFLALTQYSKTADLLYKDKNILGFYGIDCNGIEMFAYIILPWNYKPA